MGKFPLWIYCRSNANGDGGQWNCKPEWWTTRLNPLKSHRFDAWEMASWVIIKDNKLNKWVYGSPFEFGLENNISINFVV